MSAETPADAVREALLPCPFCGADDAHVIGIAATNERSVICYACGGETAHKATAAEAIAAWNRRPSLAALAGAAPVAWECRVLNSTAEWHKCSREQYDCIRLTGHYNGPGGAMCEARELFTHAPAKAREVTDADVERALNAFADAKYKHFSCGSIDADKDGIRAALATFAEGAE